MQTFIYDKNKAVYIAHLNAICTLEQFVTFDLSYEVVNPETGGIMTFNLSHSTGSEWDPETKWIYKDESGKYYFVVCQQLDITKARASSYLRGKGISTHDGVDYCAYEEAQFTLLEKDLLNPG